MIPDIEKERAEHERTYKHYKCEYCNVQLMTKNDYTKHRWECMHLVCEVCGTDFRTPEYRQRFKKPDQIFGKVKRKYHSLGLSYIK